jgi:hypothetical protein
MHCLNCHTELTGTYCPHCGQKASTHRFSLKHLFTVDFLHGALHLDKGFLYTLRALVTRPGHSIREYVQGKRVLHFNYFTLLLMALAAYIVAGQVFAPKTVTHVEAIHIRLAIFLQLPLCALISFLFFKRGEQNYAEHLVLNTYRLSILTMCECGYLIILSLGKGEVEQIEAMLYLVIEIAYSVWFFSQYFSPFYRKRTPLFFRCLAAEVISVACGVLINVSLIN